ncbi:MAG: xanthine dehydrogenase molybdopterin binding subunit, partial [Alphaproteobacteria bacterium]|nr:xanthine dehydrogenase molybdopterin binding subunit [Alphaproteobacteria bacterium]
MNALPGTQTRDSIGQKIAHDSAVLHVTGRAHYLDDLPEPPHLLHAALVTSPHPHARIISIDAAQAIRECGAIALVTAKDIPGHNEVGPILHGEPALAEEIADYCGCPIAAIVAPTHKQAIEAARLVKVEYEILKPVLSLEDAIAAKSYVAPSQLMRHGDADTALKKAPLRLSGSLDVGGQDHFYLETNIAIATPGENKTWHIFTSSQHPTEVQKHAALALGVPQAAVTAEVRRMGGGFGGKESQPTIIAVIAAIAALKTGRPVKLRLNRDDDMIVTGKRHDFKIGWEAGISPQGEILGLKAQLAARGGNVADLTPSVMARALCHLNNCYYIPHFAAEGLNLKTNTVSNTAFRGFGGPQGMIAGEAIIDAIARKLGKDRDVIRAANYFSPQRGLV